MKKMLLLSAALLAVLAGPALAQDRRGGEGRRGPDAAQAQQGGRDFNRGGAVGNGSRAPEAAPAQAQRGGGDRGGFRGGDRGQRDFGQRDNAAPAAQPNFNRGGQAAQQGNGQRDFNRGGNDNRNGYRGGNGQRDFGRNDGRRDNYNGGNYNGRNNYGRNNYNNNRYSQYYRSYNAQRRFRIGSYYRPSGYSYRRWSYGDFLPSLYWGSRYWLNNYYAYDLTPPMPGTVWVRYGDDALLIDRYSGEVIQVAYGIFW